MMIGATAFGLLAAVLIEFIIKKSKIKTDTSIGIILSSFFRFRDYLNYQSEKVVPT